MKNLIVILLILGIISCSGIVFAEETSNPVIWKSKTSSWVPFVTTTNDGTYTAASSLDGSFYLFDKSGAVLWEDSLGHRVTSISFSEYTSQLSAVTGE
ncbi:MAG: hypothetical protein GKC01_06640, partial [Candidatus Methanofastidiosa archaeon]|nr:hypothetical protein [Candidatus Methanofastidiosa archaeon]